jgi:hypothetical protein
MSATSNIGPGMAAYVDLPLPFLRLGLFRSSNGLSTGVVAGPPAGLLDTPLADDLDIHDAAQIQRFSPPQV